MKTERTSLFLMANLGSEVSRMFSSRESGDVSFAHESLKRADRILAGIKQLSDMQTRKREIDLLAEALREPAVSREELQSYFDPFVARLFASRS